MKKLQQFIRDLCFPIVHAYRIMITQYSKDYEDFGIFTVLVYIVCFIIFLYIWTGLVNSLFGIYLPIFFTFLLLLSLLYFLIVLHLWYRKKQKNVLQEEIQRLKAIHQAFVGGNFLEKLHSLHEYTLQFKKIDESGLFGKGERKTRYYNKIDNMLGEVGSTIFNLDYDLVENQEYILLFIEIQDLSGVYYDNYLLTQYGDRFDELNRTKILKRLSLIEFTNNFWCFNLGILGYLYIRFVLLSPILAGLFFFFPVLLLHLETDQSKNYKRIMVGQFSKLSRSLQFFLICKNNTILLMKSEQGVCGIEPTMVSSIAKNIHQTMKYWNQYQTDIDDCYNVTNTKYHLLSPKNPYKSIQSILQQEQLKGNEDFQTFQTTIKSWITTHIKDLQHHQQEIHQIHQSLLQKSSENTEVIDLLEKNFNLHLQSAQKVENSI